LLGFFAQAFFKKACDHTDNVVSRVFAQAFFEKACGQAVSSKGYIM